MFNVPLPVLVVVGVLLAVHAIRTWFLSEQQDLYVLVLFAFIPARYEMAALRDALWGGQGAEIWSFLSYAFLHGGWAHVVLNVVWLVAFGSVVARRFGALRFFVFLGVATAAGAGAHLFAHYGQMQPMVGASAAVSGCMAAAIRFMFAPNPYGHAPLLAALRDRRVLAFIAVWFGINIVFGLGAMPLLGEDQSIAWEAHIGGFLVGLLLFAVFDPAPRSSRP
jgi:membrane associated rhomboid family serine protease